MTSDFTTQLRTMLQGLVAGPLARLAFGPLPVWSNLTRHAVVNVTTATVGAAVFCLFLDGVEVMVVLGQRPDPGRPGHTQWNASGGGYGNLDFTEKQRYIPATPDGEQPAQMAVRELAEENRTPGNLPVLQLNPAALQLLATGVDYRAVRKPQGLPVAYTMFTAWLTAADQAAIQQHADRMDDPAYRAAAMRHTKGETARVRILSLAAAAALPVDTFAHPHEAVAVRTLQARQRAGQLRPG